MKKAVCYFLDGGVINIIVSSSIKDINNCYYIIVVKLNLAWLELGLKDFSRKL